MVFPALWTRTTTLMFISRPPFTFLRSTTRSIRTIAVIASVCVTSIASASSTAPVSFFAAEGNGNDLTGKHPATVPVIDANNPDLGFASGKFGHAFHFTGLINLGGSQTGTYLNFGSWF